MLRAVLALLLVSCTSVETRRPDWIDHPSSSCTETEICASGYGKSRSSADADARAGIAKYFRTEVGSRFKSRLDSRTEYTSLDIYETSTDSLEGAAIVERYRVADSYYSFVRLDRLAAAKSVLAKVSQADARMRTMLADSKSAGKLDEAYASRADFAGRYFVLSGQEIPEQITREDIAKAKLAAVGIQPYYIDIRDSTLSTVLAKALSNAGAKLASSETQGAKIIIGTITEKQQYINVDGFVKYLFALRLSTGANSIATEVSAIARSEAQAREKAWPRIEQFINDNLYNLIGG